jgi:hypothetical protein
MTIDCQWISKNLESVFCDRLTGGLARAAHDHISNCEHCRAEVQALIGVDSLIKKYFQQQLAVARAPRQRRMFRVYALVAAGVAAMFILIFFQAPAQITTNQPNPAASVQMPVVIAPVQSPVAPVKAAGGGTDSERAKPSSSPRQPAGLFSDAQQSAASRQDSDFIVFDPAGYARTLADYRGYVVVIGIWDAQHPDSIDGFERLYKAFGSRSSLRFLGVLNGRERKPANTTFPILYNQGSKLFGAEPGEFILLDKAGTVRLRGSLTSDFADLEQQLIVLF